MPANPWYARVNISALGDDVRRLILERVKRKLEELTRDGCEYIVLGVRG